MYKRKYVDAWVSLGVVILVAMGIGYRVTGSLAGGVLFTCLIYIVAYLSIVLHELAHAIAALLLGAQVPVVSFGGGQRARVMQLRGRWIVVGFAPSEGLTLIVHRKSERLRLHIALISAAGPVLNLFIAAIAIAIWQSIGSELSEPVQYVLAATILINLLHGVGNLWPMSITTPFGPANSDGKNILESRSLSDQQIQEVLDARLCVLGYIEYLYGDAANAAEIVAPALQKDRVTTALKVLASAAYADSGQAAAGMAVCRAALANADLQADERAALLNNLAYILSHEDSDEALAEADTLSKEAFETAPMLMPIIGTRASVLQKLGYPHAALRLVQDRRFKLESSLHQARVSCIAAKAHAALGNVVAANRCLNKARAKAPGDRCIGETERCLIRNEHPE